MDRNNKYYNIIADLVKNHRKFPGYEAILDDIIDDVYAHSEVIINSIDDESVIESYLSKVISTSIIVVPKKLKFNANVIHRTISNDSIADFIEKKDPVEHNNELEKTTFNPEPIPVNTTDETVKNDNLEDSVENIVTEKANPEFVDKLINTMNSDLVQDSSTPETNAEEYDISNIDEIEEFEEINEIEEIEDSVYEPSIENYADNLIAETNNDEIFELDTSENIEESVDTLITENIDTEESVENILEESMPAEITELNELSNNEFTEDNIESDDEKGLISEEPIFEEVIIPENIENIENIDISDSTSEELPEPTDTIYESKADIDENEIIENQDNVELFEISENNNETLIPELNISDDIELIEQTDNNLIELNMASGTEETDNTLLLNEPEEMSIINETPEPDNNLTLNEQDEQNDIVLSDVDDLISIEDDTNDLISLPSEEEFVNLEEELTEDNLNNNDDIINIEEQDISSEEVNNNVQISDSFRDEFEQDIVLKTDEIRYKSLDYDIFNYDPKNIEDKIDVNDLSEKLLQLDSTNPDKNILTIFDLRYKQNYTLEQIAIELNMAKDDVIAVLNKLVELV